MEPLLQRLPLIVDNTYQSLETCELVEKVFQNVLYMDDDGTYRNLTIYFDESNILRAIESKLFTGYFREEQYTPQQTLDLYQGH